MTDRQTALFDKARRALETARAVLKLGDAEAAVNRAYYAAFHAATAALLSVGEAPKTHAGAHQRFHLHFVASGRLSRAQGETLRHAFELRQRADYEAFTVFDEAATANLIADVEGFVETVVTLLTP